MSVNNTLTNCRYCSLVSKSNHEDPIGSSPTYDRFLLLEVKQPWKSEIWIEPDPLPQAIIDAFSLAWEREINFRPLAIAPDREYSHPDPDYTRVLYYHRPAKLFAKFEKLEFILPKAELSALVMALLHQPDELSQFDSYRQETSHIREMLVCTHGNHDAACGRFGYPIYRLLRQNYATTSERQLRVWRCSHFGGHQFAPTLLDLPEGRYWGHLEPNMLDLLIHRKGDVTGLRSFYRGWTGLTKFEQIAEREAWMQEGWGWLDYLKAGQVLSVDEINQDWAEVRIHFASVDGTTSGTYDARVDLNGEVMSARWSSFENEPLEPVKQYRVSHLTKISQ